MPPRPFPFPLRIGTDICYLPRIRNFFRIDSHGKNGGSVEGFLKRILTHPERVYFRHRFGTNEKIISSDITPVAKFLAGRFAAKEACRKACDHIANESRGFKQIVILPVDKPKTGEHSSQRPTAIVLDEALPEPRSESDSPPSFESLEGQLCEVSISHDGEYATAVALVPSMKQDGGRAEKQDTSARDSSEHASVAADGS